MKKFYLFVFLYLAGFNLYSQHRNGKFVYEPDLKTDQIIEYTWEPEKSEWVIKNRIKYNYTYEDGGIQTVTTLDYYTGIPISQIVHSYTPEQILKESIYQSWESGVWKSTRRDLWFRNDKGLTTEELIQFWQNDTWVDRIRYTDYQYSDSQLQQYTYQIWTNEQWIDTYYDAWYYDERGHLVLRQTTRMDNTPKTKYVYYVGENNLRQSLTFYGWHNDMWVESNRRLYEYNQCGKTNAVVYQLYKDGHWINSTRHVYIYSFNRDEMHPSIKVAVCHKGHTIYVSINAVDAHLAHGDCIGECLDEEKSDQNAYRNREEYKKAPFTVYPNPATDRIIVRFESDECSDSKIVELTDFFGKKIRSYKVEGNGDLTIPRGNLLDGKYYLKVKGKETYSIIVIFY